MRRNGFTLLELLIVVLVIGILGGFVWIGLRDTLEVIRVQRSGYGFMATVDQARQMAIATNRVHTIIFNNTTGVQVTHDWNAFHRSPTDSGYNATTSGVNTTWTPSRLMATDPRDQWYSLMGPWQDWDGRWWQGRGGMFTNNTNVTRDGVDANGRPLGRWFASKDNDKNMSGGYFGHRLDSQGRLPSAQWNSTTPQNVSSAVWDPMGIQIGGRRLLERGTRWMVRSDNPEWAWMSGSNSRTDLLVNRSGRNYGNLQAMFTHNIAAHFNANKPTATNEWQQTTSFNFYPNGMLDRNFCDAMTYAPSGQGFDQTERAFLGIVSTKTRETEFMEPYVVSTPVVYQRPVAQLFITFWRQGDVIMGTQPALAR